MRYVTWDRLLGVVVVAGVAVVSTRLPTTYPRAQVVQ